jgi:transcriptional regulator with XRE-family HTH domain
MSVLGKRLKDARLKSGLSQEQLGLQAGLEVESASARMNRYERGTRAPSVELMERIGNVLNLPLTYFYAADENEAMLLVLFHRMTDANRIALLDAAVKRAGASDPQKK